MNRHTLTLILAGVTAIEFVAGAIVTSRMISVQAQTKPGYGFAALAGERVGQDVDGPYNVDPNWPKPISALPGNEKWTYGAIVLATRPHRLKPVLLVRISHQFTRTAQGQRPERPSIRGDSTGIVFQSQRTLGTHCMV